MSLENRGGNEAAASNSYTVKPWDTLSKIAKERWIDIDTLAKANKIENKNVIRVGQKLEMPRVSKTFEPARVPESVKQAKVNDRENAPGDLAEDLATVFVEAQAPSTTDVRSTPVTSASWSIAESIATPREAGPARSPNILASEPQLATIPAWAEAAGKSLDQVLADVRNAPTSQEKLVAGLPSILAHLGLSPKDVKTSSSVLLGGAFPDIHDAVFAHKDGSKPIKESATLGQIAEELYASTKEKPMPGKRAPLIRIDNYSALRNMGDILNWKLKPGIEKPVDNALARFNSDNTKRNFFTYSVRELDNSKKGEALSLLSQYTWWDNSPEAIYNAAVQNAEWGWSMHGILSDLLIWLGWKYEEKWEDLKKRFSGRTTRIS